MQLRTTQLRSIQLRAMPLLQRRRLLCWLSMPAWAGVSLARAAPRLDAPNVVPISERLVTSGQPTADALSALGAAGFQAVIYLAPSDVSNAVPDERERVERQGLAFVHIPIPWGKPEPSHFQQLTEALQRLQQRKVLVHCEVNMRASTLVFLHRVITLREAPEPVWAAVTRVWSPRGVWRALAEGQLRAHGIRFELL